MSKDLMEDLRELLNDASLSTYEINAYITLLNSSNINPPSAKEISLESGVPSGRIYEVLEDLKKKGLIEIIDSRPKKFKAISLNKALDNLIGFQSKESKRKIGYLYDRAKILEAELYESEALLRKEPSKIFWSIIYGTKSILTSYATYINEAKEEIILNEFINEGTLKVIPYAKMIYEPLKNAVDRGVTVKDLWSFEYDNRPLTDEHKKENAEIFGKLKRLQEELYGLSTNLHEFEMKYVNQKTTTYFDIFDKKRIIFKLQNPLKPYQIFACMNVIDLSLAEELRNKFLSMWTFEALDYKE
ncbi:MAG: TrmB family transcriptional regulator [Promethearchaeota archaeon]